MEKFGSPPVRIADVAKAAGVSPATVSRVLGGSTHKVNEATQAKVRKVAADLGYRVNSIARALRLSTTGAVGMVVPSIANPFFTELVEQVEHQLTSLEINLFLSDSRNDPEIEARKVKSLSNGAVDGVLVVPVHQTASEAAVAAAARAIPVVQLDRQITGLRIPWVGVEDRSGIRDIVTHLAQQGARSLGILTSTAASLSAAVRTSEVRAQAAQLGLALDDKHVLDTAFTIDAGIEAVDRLLEHGPLPDALVCIDDILAIGVLGGLRRRGIRVPEDVLLTGFDGIRYSWIMSPTLTTVRQPLERIAAEGVRLLADPEAARTGIQVALPGDLVIRESTTRPGPGSGDESQMRYSSS